MFVDIDTNLSEISDVLNSHTEVTLQKRKFESEALHLHSTAENWTVCHC